MTCCMRCACVCACPSNCTCVCGPTELKDVELETKKVGTRKKQQTPEELQKSIKILTDKVKDLDRLRSEALRQVLLMERKRGCDFLRMWTRVMVRESVCACACGLTHRSGKLRVFGPGENRISVCYCDNYCHGLMLGYEVCARVCVCECVRVCCDATRCLSIALRSRWCPARRRWAAIMW